MTDLKPCPFCGHDVTIYEDDLETDNLFWVIRCGWCNAMIYDDCEDKEQIVERWNRRVEV
ncbi:Lar family restriction alleviation protein [Methanomassiliicoccales archaeon LGM-RCC1]|nr:Lar family restriction alleviation protein [Methanomassiliicoccales archaeon LGM-RCC1]